MVTYFELYNFYLNLTAATYVVLNKNKAVIKYNALFYKDQN